MIKWTLSQVELPLKYKWKTSRSSTQIKKNFVVEVENSGYLGRGEVAFLDRFGDSADKIQASFAKFAEIVPKDLGTLESLIEFVEKQEIVASLRAGIEIAFVHYLGAVADKTVHELLGLNTINAVKTSYSIPILPPGEIAGFIQKYNLQRFDALKIKVDMESGLDSVREVWSNFSGNIRIDANEAWSNPDEVLAFIEALGVNCPIEFLEQPLGADKHQEYLYLKKNSEVDLMADESILDGSVTKYHQERFHGVNIKLMKAGGYMKALLQLKTAKELYMTTMIGCMVETSLGISSALNIASRADYIDLDGCLMTTSDPYKLITEENGRLFYSHLQ